MDVQNMNYEIISAPLIGAVIGLITNDIAIKMLFRPWKPIYIGKLKVPFTPGLIPKEQPRIAKAIGSVVGNELLDNVTIKDTLLSDETKNKMMSYIDTKIKSLSENTQPLSEYLNTKGLLDDIDQKESTVKHKIAESISEKLITSNVGATLVDFAAEELVKNANHMIGGIASKAIHSARDSLVSKVNNLIKEKAPDIIADLIDSEYCKLKDKSISEFIDLITSKFPDYHDRIWNLYSLIINKQLAKILHGFNIQEIVEQKIKEYEIPELERLIMSITKKELNSLVILGGILGFVMGFLNILF